MISVILVNLFQVNASKGDSLNKGNNGLVRKQVVAKDFFFESLLKNLLNRFVHKIFFLHYVMYIIFVFSLNTLLLSSFT
jgi:hypothetical protein